ncbi:YqgE/AlgH family protein, partial [Deinococcus soli (ex Cha et al. 2016)]
DVLRAVERSGQPFMLVLGYAGWGAGQLTEEAREGTWVWVEQATPELLWDVPAEERWQSALDRLGVDASRIVPGGAQA